MDDSGADYLRPTAGERSPWFSCVAVRVPKVLGVLLLATSLAPSSLHAYVDPVSGSLILQLLAAGFLALTVSFKRVWAKISSLARSLKPGSKDD